MLDDLIKKVKELIAKLRQEKLSLKGKIIIAVLALVCLVGGGTTAYLVFDYTQNNPKFCVSCHLMSDAYAKWENSVHKNINCHDCHHLSVEEMNGLMYSFIVHRPTELPDRHGKIIVPWKYCVKCHWEESEDDEYKDAPKINSSKIHSNHYFTQQIQCTKCHGYKAHMFKPEPKFCVMCHEDKEVHSEGMTGLNCLNCHTDTEANMLPDRDKCLYCHGNESQRQALLSQERADVEFCATPDGLGDSKLKIKLEKDSPMQFMCYQCHQPHEKGRPDWSNCTDCHDKEAQIGKHRGHLNDYGATCSDCHKPHLWSVTDANKKAVCSQCHEYRSPENFLK